MATNEPPPTPPGSPPPPPAPPPSPSATSAARWRDLRWSCYAVYGALGATVIAIAYALATQIEQRGLVPDGGGFGSISDLNRLVELDDRVDSLNDAFLALVVVTGLTFIVWTWRAAKNNEALGRAHPRLGAGWAIGGWLIPIANLVIPVLIMQDLWRGSDSSIPRDDSRWKIGDRSLLVGFWWGLLLFGRALIVAGAAVVDRGGADNLRSGLNLQIVGNMCTLAAAVLAVLVVRTITARQYECLRVQQVQWTGAQAAPPPS